MSFTSFSASILTMTVYIVYHCILVRGQRDRSLSRLLQRVRGQGLEGQVPLTHNKS